MVADAFRLVRPRLLLGVAILGGCSKPPSVVGVWKGTLFQEEVTTEFKEDRTLTLGLRVGEMGANFTGTYTIDPKLLTITITDYKLKNVPDTLMPLAIQTFDPMRGKAYRMIYHFNSENELSLKYQNKVDVLKRDATDQG